MRQVVFDLETTGFKFAEGHRIVEIGAVELINGAVTGRNFHTYINPKRDMPMGAYKVHGLSAAFLSDKPDFTDPEAGPAFCAFIEDAELIAHNGIGFDLPFIQAELSAAQLPTLSNKLFDTLLFARKKFPGAPASLDALCSRFGIDLNQREKDGHGALLDSKLLAEVYIELTGGAQAGFDLTHKGSGTKSGKGASDKAGQVRKRAEPLDTKITAQEREAHAAFIAELGDDSVWRKFSDQATGA